ncbi:MAG: SDR family oxidoreductase [Spirochaetales bacterium]|jgi:pteridine reductase|nr:SDR family oxidoreductase [Spirochaetales bacterium]
MWNLAGKTAIITGAGKRLGRAAAIALADAGSNVIVHYRSSREDAQNAAEEIRAKGVKAWVIQADLRSSASIKKFTGECGKTAGKVDILVNSASIFPEGSILDSPVEAFVENLETNAIAPLLLARWLADQCDNGVIINFLDTRILDYDRNHVPYHISKQALFSITRMLSDELAPEIRVNAVAPGLILPPPGKTDEYLKELAHTNPLQRWGSEIDISQAVLYLIKADFVTGQVLYIDGGRHIKGRFYGS